MKQLQDAAGFFYCMPFSFISCVYRQVADQRGQCRYLSGLIIFISLLLLSYAYNGFILLLSGALVALGFGTLMSCSQAIAIRKSPKLRVGLATSTFFICLDGGMGIGPYLTGMIVQSADFRGTYLALAIVVFLSVILYYYVHGKQ